MTVGMGVAWVGERIFGGNGGEARSKTGWLGVPWQWLLARRRAQSRVGRLRVAESASLGEKRFVAVIEVDGRQFLVGGGAANVTLLAQLHPAAECLPRERPFDEVLQQSFGPGSGPGPGFGLGSELRSDPSVAPSSGRGSGL